MAGIFFLFYSFRTGLFNGYGFSFEKKLVGAALFSLIFILVMSIHLIKTWKDKSWRSVLSIAIWLLPLSYGLASINAISDNYANIMTMISCLLAGFFSASTLTIASTPGRPYADGSAHRRGRRHVYIRPRICGLQCVRRLHRARHSLRHQAQEQRFHRTARVLLHPGGKQHDDG